ncbi:hypothetical protein CDES_05170 [Corynebacterium deserti GIMN1.010]|uniref:DMT family transporter n=1 Tax=Corynebacterium deserti GIMN1.010 TaxID=931089 RepID=A0A0M4CHR2_9CORY|nr:DMT family transporter [Corynebacterium deserti]ALC05471.1 hypothetical protein CDES_05170 [Corynebacterium deserti GIMN1.010]
MLAMLFGVIAGAIMPIQTSVNNRLRQSVGAPLMASFISFFVGTLSLIIATWITSGHPYPGLASTAGQPWWIFIGGALGVVVLTGNIVLFPRVGSVQTVILPITGQILMGLLIDAFGLWHSPHAPLTLLRILGAVAVLLGSLGAVGVFSKKIAGQGSVQGASIWLWRALGIVMGMCQATQVAINGRLGIVLGSAVEAALISFAVGTAVLYILLVLTRTPWRGIYNAAGEKNPWWMWTGGIIGATVIFSNAFLAPIIGTGVTVVVMLLGMMLASLLIDASGFLNSPRRTIYPAQIIGLIVIIAGVALIRL